MKDEKKIGVGGCQKADTNVGASEISRNFQILNKKLQVFFEKSKQM